MKNYDLYDRKIRKKYNLDKFGRYKGGCNIFEKYLKKIIMGQEVNH